MPEGRLEGRDRARRPLRPTQLVSARQRLNPATASALFQLADGAVLAAVLLIGSSGLGHGSIALGPLAAVVMAWGLGCAGAYHFPRNERLRSHLSLLAIVVCGMFAVAHVMLPIVAPRAESMVSPVRAGAGVCALAALHIGWWSWVQRWRRMGLLTPNIVIVGATPVARDLIVELVSGRNAGEVNVIGIFDDRADRSPQDILGVPMLGSVDALLTHRTLSSVDRVVITVPAGAAQRVAELVDRISVLPHEIMLVVDHKDDRAVARLGALPLARLEGHRITARRAAVKRAQDIVLAGLALVAASPLFVAVAVAVALDSPGPIFFRQKRHGFNNEEFLVWKFRSMRTEASDATASRQVTADDDRVTRVGRFIRRTSLDELPQLLNVLRGEMSLVGPRPHAIGMKSGGADAASLINSYGHRHRLKPGLTGLAAINGSRGPVDDLESLQRRLLLDLNYIERQSFWLDLWIMLCTAPLVLGDRSAAR